MIDPWIPLLASLPLSRTEREVVKRFESDPNGRTFLPVADILRAHRLVDESLELLTQGVECHAGFTVARVVLARELLQKGMVENAWRTLEDSPVPLKDNLLAQKLRFKLALLLGVEEAVRATHQHLKLHQMLDADSKRLGDLLEVSGLAKAREKLIKDLQGRGVELVLPPLGAASSEANAAAAGQASLQEGQGSQVGKGGAAAASPGFTGADEDWAPSAFFKDETFDDGAAGFHVVALEEIFRPSDQDAAGRTQGGAGIELDSTTLADIYARQGHYSKALDVYRRLLRMSPHNDLLRRKVAELVRLDRDQRDVDLTVDPSLVDKMETVEIIDRQIKFYNELLSRLS